MPTLSFHRIPDQTSHSGAVLCTQRPLSGTRLICSSGPSQTSWNLETPTVNKRFSASVDETVTAASGKGPTEEWRQGQPRDVVFAKFAIARPASLAKGRRGPGVQPRHAVKLQDGLERAVQMSLFPQPPATPRAVLHLHVVIQQPSRVQPSFSGIAASSRSTAGNPIGGTSP
jgi:hypothetical protein